MLFPRTGAMVYCHIVSGNDGRKQQTDGGCGNAQAQRCKNTEVDEFPS